MPVLIGFKNMVMWGVFEESAPDLARAIRARFQSHPHHVLGTIAASGVPRLSGINVFFDDGNMWFGSMPGARKAVDLRRDPRMSVHSVTVSETLDGGDARVDGVAKVLDPDVARRWRPDNPGDGFFFTVDISRAHLVEVRGEDLIVTMWDESRGLRSVSRQ